jgi:hypothetical protein
MTLDGGPRTDEENLATPAIDTQTVMTPYADYAIPAPCRAIVNKVSNMLGLIKRQLLEIVRHQRPRMKEAVHRSTFHRLYKKHPTADFTVTLLRNQRGTWKSIFGSHTSRRCG